MTNCMQRLAGAVLAGALSLSMAAGAFAAWKVVDAEYNEDGTIRSGTLVLTNGGEDFDPAALTFAAMPQWKIDLINAQTLTPRATGFEELDRLVAERLAVLITPDMSNYQKLVAVYNDIVRNCSYSLPIYGSSHNGLDPWRSNPPKTYLMSYTDCCYATYLLRNNAGVCDEYSAAFVALANAIGFEAYDMAGQINGNGHGWSLLRLGDDYYIFDTQAEQVNIKSNQVRYVNFCLRASAATSYVPVDGCLQEQISYRNNGAVAKVTPIASAADATGVETQLIAYGESQMLDYSPGMNSRVYFQAMASEFSSRDELVRTFQGYLDNMIGTIRLADGRWWYETGEYYLDGNLIRLVNGDGICGQVDERGRPSGGYKAFGLRVEPAAAGNGDYVITIYGG